ncbi:MAG: DUF4838 domain-containing protein [bacterium]
MRRPPRNIASRRFFLQTLASGAMLGFAAPCRPANSDREMPYFKTRGVVLIPDDLTLEDWPARAKQANLTTIALHNHQSIQTVTDLIQSEKGAKFLSQCRELKLEVEYELHAVKDLLPRDLFDKNPALFRMNETGERVPDFNLCVSNEQAIDVVCEKAVAVSEILRPTTGRYFFWGDDAKPWCRCSKCRELSETDQALVLENRILNALRRIDPNAQLAHLCYANTLSPPAAVQPAAGIFLEFAPIERHFDIPFDTPHDAQQKRHLELLDVNLEIFGSETAQALEYWLDVSKFTGYKKPAKKLPFHHDCFRADLDTYGSRGIRHITTFAAYIDAEYVANHGDPPLDIYGRELAAWKPCD